MVLLILSVIHLQDGTDDPSKNKTLMKVASGLLALAWALLAIWSLWSLGKTRGLSSKDRIPSFHGGMLVSSNQSRNTF